MKWPIRNLHLKLLALGLALLTWFTLRGRMMTESGDLRCPVSLVVPENVLVHDAELLGLDIRVQGPAARIGQFRPNEDTLRLDARAEIAQALAGDKPSATVVLSIERRDFQLPRRVSLLEWPKSIRLDVERLERKVALPVKVTVVGTPQTGYRIVEDKIETKPTMVRLDLGAVEAGRVEAVMTTPVNVDGRSDTVHDVAAFVDPGREGQQPLGRTADGFERVEVTIPIEPVIEQKEISPVPVLVVRRPGDATRISIDPATVAVSVTGRADRLASLGPDDVTAYLELKEQQDPGVPYTWPVTVIIEQPGIRVVKAPSVTVTVE